MFFVCRHVEPFAGCSGVRAALLHRFPHLALALSVLIAVPLFGITSQGAGGYVTFSRRS
jgi:F0F1-type ATP synthase membrane subunit a